MQPLQVIHTGEVQGAGVPSPPLFPGEERARVSDPTGKREVSSLLVRSVPQGLPAGPGNQAAPGQATRSQCRQGPAADRELGGPD